MTRITFKNRIDNTQMSVLMSLFDSWNVKAEITDEKMPENKSFSQLFSKTRGMWQDYDIDASNQTTSGNAETVQNALESIRSKCLFSDIADPVAYQKQLRDEWR